MFSAEQSIVWAACTLWHVDGFQLDSNFEKERIIEVTFKG